MNITLKSAIINWFDELNTNSYRLAAKHYGIKLELQHEVTDTELLLLAVGEADKMQKFFDDFNDGEVEPMASLSRKYEFDEDYRDAVDELVAALNK